MHIADFGYLLRLHCVRVRKGEDIRVLKVTGLDLIALRARAKRRGADGPSPFALMGLCRVADAYMIY